jgi:hypothetical protein
VKRVKDTQDQLTHAAKIAAMGKGTVFRLVLPPAQARVRRLSMRPSKRPSRRPSRAPPRNEGRLTP